MLHSYFREGGLALNIKLAWSCLIMQGAPRCLYYYMCDALLHTWALERLLV